MSKKRLHTAGGMVYSTDPDFKLQEELSPGPKTLLPAEQKIKIRLDSKHRAGKVVTLLEGFVGTNTDREALEKKLKTFCGTGGSVKENAIIVQGDNRDKVLQWLHRNGYSAAKRM